MASLKQIETLKEMIYAGYKVLGPVSKRLGASLLLLAPSGAKFILHPSGKVFRTTSDMEPAFHYATGAQHV